MRYPEPVQYDFRRKVVGVIQPEPCVLPLLLFPASHGIKSGPASYSFDPEILTVGILSKGDGHQKLMVALY